MYLALSSTITGVSSDIVILARNSEALVEAKQNIEALTPGVNIYPIQADLSDLDSLQATFERVVDHADDSTHRQFVLIHNAGSMSDITRPAIQQSDPAAVQQYFELNYTSMFVLTAHFLSRFTAGHRTVINISSLLAKVSLPSFSMYGPTRAARNALMGVLSVENPDVRFLTYTPGPCDTAMTSSIMEQSYSASVRKDFKELYTRKTIVSCEQSISKLVAILSEDKFENAAVIDYYDD